jgi:hypothetical protein
MPASSSPTKPPVMYFMKMGKYLRNHSRFSRKRGDSAMQLVGGRRNWKER